MRTWAEMSGVSPEYALAKRASTCEVHGWEVNGRLIDWKHRWKRFWEADREGFFKKNRAAAPLPPPACRPYS